EYRIDRGQYRCRRAERGIEIDLFPAPPGAGDCFGEVLPHPLEAGRIGALEAEDRLLAVADREDRALDLARALADEEFLGECRHHLPLLGIGVLSLVDQDVVDAAIELV